MALERSRIWLCCYLMGLGACSNDSDAARVPTAVTGGSRSTERGAIGATESIAGMANGGIAGMGRSSVAGSMSSWTGGTGGAIASGGMRSSGWNAGAGSDSSGGGALGGGAIGGSAAGVSSLSSASAIAGNGASGRSVGTGGLVSTHAGATSRLGFGGTAGGITAGTGVSGSSGLPMGGNGGLPSSCTPIDFRDVGTQADLPKGCPIDVALPDCRAQDVDALVARSAACIDATNALRHCAPLPSTIDFSERDLVVVSDPFGGCAWPIEIDSVLDCAAEVKLAFSVHEPCNSCDWPLATVRFLSLPKGSKPVKASAKLIGVSEGPACH